jgi:hypothetical protein
MKRGRAVYKIGTFGKKADAFISRMFLKHTKINTPFPKGDVLISASEIRTRSCDGSLLIFRIVILSGWKMTNASLPISIYGTSIKSPSGLFGGGQ